MVVIVSIYKHYCSIVCALLHDHNFLFLMCNRGFNTFFLMCNRAVTSQHILFCCQAAGLFFEYERESYHAHGSMFCVLVVFHPDENVFTLMKTDKREEDEKGIHQGTCPSSSGGPAYWFLSCFGVDGSKYRSRHIGITITRLFTDFIFLLNLIQQENGD